MNDQSALVPIDEVLRLDASWPKLLVDDRPFLVVRDRAYLADEVVHTPWPLDGFVRGHGKPGEIRIEREPCAGGLCYGVRSYIEPDDDESDGFFYDRLWNRMDDVFAVASVTLLEGPDDADLPVYDERLTADAMVAMLNHVIEHSGATLTQGGAARTKALKSLAKAPPRVWLEVVERVDLNEIALGWIGQVSTWVPLRTRVASNPNTPLSILFKLSGIAPYAVVDNPAFSFYLLGDPDLPNKLHPQAKAAYLERSGDPSR